MSELNLPRKIIAKYCKNNRDKGMYLFQISQGGEPAARSILPPRKKTRLAVGLRYFGLAQFWRYENSRRFSMETSVSAIKQSPWLLNEFLGYPLNGWKFELHLEEGVANLVPASRVWC